MYCLILVLGSELWSSGILEELYVLFTMELPFQLLVVGFLGKEGMEG